MTLHGKAMSCNGNVLEKMLSSLGLCIDVESRITWLSWKDYMGKKWPVESLTTSGKWISSVWLSPDAVMAHMLEDVKLFSIAGCASIITDCNSYLGCKSLEEALVKIDLMSKNSF